MCVLYAQEGQTIEKACVGMLNNYKKTFTLKSFKNQYKSIIPDTKDIIDRKRVASIFCGLVVCSYWMTSEEEWMSDSYKTYTVMVWLT